MMPFTSNNDHLPRRNARSFDLDDSAAKAAAWVWHLHTSKPGVSTEGRFISSQSRRRSSSSYDRKATRFRQEAFTTTNTIAGQGNETETPMWDCGSKLYDTFELVAFGNRLDRSLMEVVPITPPQAHPQEHHVKSPLHEPRGILRTLSLSRSLSRQTSKNRTASSSPSPNKFKQSNSYSKNGTRASSTGSAQKGAAKWSRVGKLMNVIKKVVVLHKEVSFLGCKRSTNVIEFSQRPLDSISERKDHDCTESNQFLLNGKVRANISTRNGRESECNGDESSHYFKAWSNSDNRGTYKLSVPSKEKFNYNYVSSLGDKASMSKKIRSHSESISDGLSEHRKIRSRRKSVGDEVVFMESRIKGSNLEGVNVKERIKNANYEHLDHFKHLHHHHHHHHHHHYLHPNLVSESARFSPETMAHISAEQSWLV